MLLLVLVLCTSVIRSEKDHDSLVLSIISHGKIEKLLRFRGRSCLNCKLHIP